MKKKLCALALALVTAFACTPLTACGGGDDSHTITFYHTMGSNLRDVLDAYIAEFKVLYPEWTIKHEQIGNYDDVRDKISDQLTVGKQPDMAYCYPDHVALYNIAGAVKPLDEYINSTEEITHADGTTEILGLTQAQIDDFIPGYYEEGRQFGDGKMYTMPFSKSTEVLYYNKTFFDANNLKVPTTWDEMETVCQQIIDLDPNKGTDKKTYLPLGYDSEANWFITMTEQLGTPYTSTNAPYYLFDNAENKAFVSRFANWYAKGYVTTQEIYGKYTSGLFISTTGAQSFMSIGSSAGATHQRPNKVDGEYPFEVGIATIPQANPENPKVISQGPSVCIFKNKNTEKEKMCWLFLKYLTTSVAFQAEFSSASGYVPVLKSVADFPAYKAKLDTADGGDNIAFLSAKVCMEQADAYYTSPAFPGSSKARDEVGSLLQKVLLDPTTIDAAFSDAVNKCKYQYNG